MLEYLLIKKEHEQQTVESLELLPYDVLVDMADFFVTQEQYIRAINLANGLIPAPKEPKTEAEAIKLTQFKRELKDAKELMEAMTSGLYFVIPYENNSFDVGMAEDDSVAISCNDEMLVYIKRNDIGYSVDVYNQKQQNEDGLFGSITVFDDELDESEED